MAAQAAVVSCSSGLKVRGSPLVRGVSSQGRFPLDPKHVITIMRLLRNVGLDDLVSDVATAATEVAASPDMAPPKPLAQVRELGEQAIGTFAFHPLDEATDGDMRRDGDHDMDMIRRDMPLQDIDARLPTFFPYNRPHPLCDLTAQDLVAIFGDPHDMEVDGKRRMGAMAIVTHAPQSTQNLLKLPPKGGGFDPPNWRQ